jgi:MoaA/NifB/PqqE/SkfB family radical SAM enzyme
MIDIPKTNSLERIHVELTSRCNFKCVSCRHGHEVYGNDLGDAMCDMLIHELMPGIKEIELQGTGESLLNQNFEKIFEAANMKKTCRIILITNASMLTEEWIARFTRANMQLIISLDGTDVHEFKLHRPVGDFVQIMENMHKIRHIKANNINNYFSFVINMVITKYNYRSIKKMIDLAYVTGADFLFCSEVRPCMPNLSAWNILRLDNMAGRVAFNAYISECSCYAVEKKIGFYFNPYTENKHRKKSICPAPWRHIFIQSNGDVSPCCEINAGFGNINKNDFLEIWNGEQFNDFRNRMLLGDYDRHCAQCCLPWGLTGE